ncbi:MAG: hypothetical protein LQ342_001418 [Letrouitia transgressa]|nr:MAG: hypothetical protein LQ342_001418 [Letrouitia transgressa]
MPPQRTSPPSKAIKTERTHEENQERAYIAASRRSDRSLEARVESARRASEIHKRRTGRSLRVTEQDVVNEEMYEEEDDDLPLQYKRLTAHLRTGSADFDRRLSAYITNQVAMKSALDQAVNNSYAQQYPNAPQFAHNQPGMYPSPFLPQTVAQHHTPQSYMQSNTGSSPAFQAPNPANPVSTASNHSPTGYIQSPQASSPPSEGGNRRQSLHSTPASPVAVRTPQVGPSRPSVVSIPSYDGERDPSIHGQTQGALQAPHVQPTASASYLPQDVGPLTTSLPPESRMLLGTGTDLKDSLSPMCTGANDSFMPSSWPSSQASLLKARNFQPSYDGMSATLAPSALDMSPHHFQHSQHPLMINRLGQTTLANLQEGGIPDFSKGWFQRSNSSHSSGTATPGPIDCEWDAFINDTSWAENAT